MNYCRSFSTESALNGRRHVDDLFFCGATAVGVTGQDSHAEVAIESSRSKVDLVDDAGAQTQAGFYDWQGLEHGGDIPLPDVRAGATISFRVC